MNREAQPAVGTGNRSREGVFVRRYLVAAVVLVVAAGVEPADAAVADVSITGSSFSPSAFTTTLGDTVIWENHDPVNHSAVSNAGGFFNTGTIGPATQGNASFLAAGLFAYHCAFHPLLMHGRIRIPLRVSTSATAVGHAIRLTAAEDTAPTGLTFDYQKRVPGGTWTTFKSGTTKTRIRFVPRKAGTYRFRSRVHKSGRSSGWSPARTVAVAAG
jgi:plastocyanin